MEGIKKLEDIEKLKKAGLLDPINRLLDNISSVNIQECCGEILNFLKRIKDSYDEEMTKRVEEMILSYQGGCSEDGGETILHLLIQKYGEDNPENEKKILNNIKELLNMGCYTGYLNDFAETPLQLALTLATKYHNDHNDLLESAWLYDPGDSDNIQEKFNKVKKMIKLFIAFGAKIPKLGDVQGQDEILKSIILEMITRNSYINSLNGREIGNLIISGKLSPEVINMMEDRETTLRELTDQPALAKRRRRGGSKRKTKRKRKTNKRVKKSKKSTKKRKQRSRTILRRKQK